MNIKMTKDAHHRVDGARSLSYRTDGGSDGEGSYTVPRSIGASLIKRNVAVEGERNPTKTET